MEAPLMTKDGNLTSESKKVIKLGENEFTKLVVH